MTDLLNGRDAAHPGATNPSPRLVVVAPLRYEARALRPGVVGSELLRCGMGPRRATAASHAVSQRIGAGDVVVVAGFAGALNGSLAPAQVVVASSITDGDATRALPSAALVAAQLRRDGIDAVVAPLVSSRQVVRGAARGALARSSGADAADTESFWLLASVPEEQLARVAIVRVIVDTPDQGLSFGIVGRGVRGASVLRRLGPSLQAWAAACGPRRMLLAGPRSFCAGVERAIDIVRRALDRFGAPVYVRRQIVHNTHVVQELESSGAVFVDEIDEVPEGATVVLAAHGVTPDVHAEAHGRGRRVIDATCPLVAKVHTEARRFANDGYDIVLVGHAEHEEVVGTRGEAPGSIIVVDDPADVPTVEVRDPNRVAYLTQTTLATDETGEIVTALRARFPAIVGPRGSDICYATQNRQDAVRAVAPECDVLLVVGSHNSSNSNRLVEVARRAGRPAYLIEDASELDLRWLAGADTVAVSAGASAPELLVEQLIERLSCLGPIEVVDRQVLVEDVRFQLPVEVR